MATQPNCEPEWLEPLETSLGYRFRNIELLVQSLTHTSYAHENLQEEPLDNERLEFLGDAVLDLVVTHLIMDRFKQESEGELTRIRALIVNERSLARVSKKLDLGRYMRMGKGEEQTGGRGKLSILANCYEAVIGAVYLDGGYTAVFGVLQSHFLDTLNTVGLRSSKRDFKSLLQEQTQKRKGTIPQYVLLEASGPEHEKTFLVQVRVEGVTMGSGEGRSKKEAEQRAASEALQKIGSESEAFQKDAPQTDP
jgi:ribonuclease-3